MEVSNKSIKLSDDKYIRYRQRIGLRVCNNNYEYMTLIRHRYNNKKYYKLKLTNIHPFIKQYSQDYRDFSNENNNRLIDSGWYFMNIYHFISPTKVFEDEYIRFGDVVFLCTFADVELLIVGYDAENRELTVSNFDELIHAGLKRPDISFMRRSLRNYEWVIEKIPISKEESIIENATPLSTPNIHSMKFCDTFIIRPYTSDDIIFSKNLISEDNTYINGLDLGKVGVAGKNGYWMALPSNNSEFPLPNWYKQRNILKKRKFEGKSSFFSNTLCYINIDSIKNSNLNELANNYLSDLKIPILEVGMPNLISDPPIGWSNTDSSDLSISKYNPKFEISCDVSPSFGGYLFDHAIFSYKESPLENNHFTPLNSYPSKIQEQLLLEDILSCLMCAEGNYIKVIEHISIVERTMNGNFSESLFLIQNFENKSINNKSEITDINFSVLEGLSTFSYCIINDPSKFTSKDILKSNTNTNESHFLGEFNPFMKLEYNGYSESDNKDPLLIPLTHRILELSSCNRRIKQFLNKHGDEDSNFGLISDTLCETFRELIKHFEIKIYRFETLIRKGSLTLQNFWSQSQQAFSTLKTMDLIATRALYKKGCEIINVIFDLIHERFQGENTSIKVSNFILGQLLSTWVKHFLIPWMKYGKVNDYYSEFGHFDYIIANKSVNNGIKLQKFPLLFGNINIYKLDSKLFPKCLQSIFEEANYIGNVSQFIFQSNVSTRDRTESVDFLSLQIDFEKMLKLLDSSTNIKFDALCEYLHSIYHECRVKLYNYCCERVNIRDCLGMFKDIFFCSNDTFIQEFIDCIGIHSLGGNLSGNCFHNYISHKWNILANKYYEKCIKGENLELYCTFDKRLITERINEVVCYNNDWNGIDSLEESTSMNIPHAFPKFEAFKHLTLKLKTKNYIQGLIWTENTISKYQVIFRFIFHLKYIQKLLIDIWFVQKTTPIWEYIHTNSGIYEGKAEQLLIYQKMSKSYLLRHKMLSTINGILEYILHDVIEFSWNAFMERLGYAKTIEDVIKLQDKTLEEIMSLCFYSKYESFCSLYKLISIGHLFARYSALFNIYGGSRFGNSSNIYKGRKNTKYTDESNKKERSISSERGRYGIDLSHIKLLLADSSFENIINKLDSKFSLFLNDFIVLSQKEKHPRQHTLNKLLEKLNSNGYFKKTEVSRVLSDNNIDHCFDSEYEEG